MILYSLLLFLLCFWTINFGIKFEEAKIMFLHGLEAPRCIAHLQVYSHVFINTQNVIQFIKMSSQLFVALLRGFVAFPCDQLQAWILKRWENIFESRRRFLFETYPKTKDFLIFYTKIIVLELQVALLDQFFTILLGHNCWQGSITFWNSTWWTSNLEWLT